MPISLVEPISAITSWENYEYQGHMALHIALKKILELIQKGESISDYDLQIEGEEDFSIRREEKYLSIHQVKAGKVYLKPNDKFCFIMEILQTGAEYGYFHITNGKKISTNFVSETVKYISLLKNELSKKIIEKKDVPATESEDNYIVLDKISGEHKKGDVYSIIKYVSENSKDKAKIKLSIREITNVLNEYKTIIKEKKEEFKKANPLLPEDEAFLCTYKEKYDNIKEIRKKAYETIVSILRIECPEYNSFVDNAYADLVYNKLLLYMKDRITEFHIEQNKDGKCILTFDEIVEQIAVDYHEEIDTIEYQYFQVLRSIRDAYAEYPSESWNSCKEQLCKDCRDSDACNLYKQISILNNKPEAEKNQIIHNLILKTPQKGKSNNLPQDSLISHLFLNLLDEIKTLGLGRNNVYEAIKDGFKAYRLTLDSSYDISEFQRSLQKEIGKDADRSLLFEYKVLITDRLCEENLFFDGEKVSVLTEKELNEISTITSSTIEKINKDCNRPNIIRVINKNTAIGELK